MVANPRAVRHFAQATDAAKQERSAGRGDAARVRLMRMEFTAWTRPEESTLAVVGHRAAAAGADQAVHGGEKSPARRRNFAGTAGVCAQPAWRARYGLLQREIQNTARARRRRYIAGDARLQRRYQLLRTMPGIGPISAVQILAELALLPADRDVRQWVAYAGLDPREHSSGTSVKKHARISKVGNRHLRCALFMPALVASHCEPHLRGFYEHLLAAGKKKKQALTAVARKDAARHLRNVPLRSALRRQLRLSIADRQPYLLLKPTKIA